MKPCSCGSYAINQHLHGRMLGVDLDLCDVCYWRKRAAVVAMSDEQIILTLAAEFTDANDRGDAAADALEALPDDQDDYESAGLQQASEAADEDYNRTKALLFAAVREWKGLKRTAIPRGWEIEAARAVLASAPATPAAADVLAETRDAFTKILRTPAMPFPDPGAHSLEAYAQAVHSAWCQMRFIAMGAIERLDRAGEKA